MSIGDNQHENEFMLGDDYMSDNEINDDTDEIGISFVGGRVESITVPTPTVFESEEMALLRKAAWMAATKYEGLASEEEADGNLRRSRYWTQKHDEMLALWEKLSGVASLVQPPF